MGSNVITVMIVGTESFWNNYSSQSPSDKADNIQSWMQNEWVDHIEDGSNEYDAGFTLHYPSSVEIPESALPDNNDLSERLYAADDWLKNNESDVYDGGESITVIDYYGADSNTYGWGYIGTAGGSDNICGLVDTHHEDNGNLPSELSQVESEGVAFHELLHTFDAKHPDHVSTYTNSNLSYGEISIMYSWDGVSCKDRDNTDVIEGKTSSCTETAVRNHIDAHNLS